MRRFLTGSLLLAAGLVAVPSFAAPSTTVVISEFRLRGPSGANDEYIEIYNLSNAPVTIGGYKLRNSSSGGGLGQGLRQVPAGVVLAPGAFYLFANNATGGYSGTTTPDQTFADPFGDDGGIGLLTSGDVLVDAVGLASGNQYKEGTTLPKFPLTAPGVAYRRKGGNCTPSQDTDNNANDFEAITTAQPQNRASCCADTQCASPPSQCQTGSCNLATNKCSYAIETGKTCNDANACTSTDVCSAAGACQGTSIACDTPPAPQCINGNTQQRTFAATTCNAGACTYPSTDTACAPGSCNPATGLCGDPCQGKVCDSPPNAACFNAAGTCNPTTGSCEYTEKAVGTPCNDSALCTLDDKCDAAAVCTGTPKACIPPATECVGTASRSYSAGACVAGTGACSFQQTDTNCEFGCEAASGQCKPNPCAGVSCNTPPNGCFEAIGVCDSANGLCTYAPKPGNTPCVDGVACTENDVCNGAGVCAGSTKSCNPPAPTCIGNTSRTLSNGSCTAATGACAFTTKDTPCASGCNAATGLCNNDPCAGVVCNNPPSACSQSVGTCSQGSCTYAKKPENAQCDDGDACTTADRCNLAGVCAGTTLGCNTPPAPSCTSPTTSLVYAAAGTCGGGTCSYTSAPTTCAFGCDASTGRCSGDPCTDVVCTSPPSACHVAVGACSNGTCSYPLKTTGSTCDDKNPCTTTDTCDAAGACKGSTKVCNTPPAPKCLDASTSQASQASGTCGADGSCAYTSANTVCPTGCDAATGLCKDDPCGAITCNTPPSACHAPTGTCAAGTCTYALLQDGSACDDGNACTVKDACSAAGACLGVTKVCNTPPAAECLDTKQSRVASPVGKCGAVDGVCGYDITVNQCPAGCNVATGLCNADPCAGVVCNEPPSACHLETGACNKEGTCDYTLKPSGAECTDGDDCTEADVCDEGGACQGKPVISEACGTASGGEGGTSGTGGAAGSPGKGGAAGKGGTTSKGGSAGSVSVGGAAGKGTAGKGGSGTAGKAGAGGDPLGEEELPVANACGCSVPGAEAPSRFGAASFGAFAALALAWSRVRSRRRQGLPSAAGVTLFRFDERFSG